MKTGQAAHLWSVFKNTRKKEKERQEDGRDAGRSLKRMGEWEGREGPSRPWVWRFCFPATDGEQGSATPASVSPQNKEDRENHPRPIR